MKKTKMCKSCRKKNSIKPTADKVEFLEDLINLIKLFDHDTGQKIVKDDFFSIETYDNLVRIFDKEKASVFNAQKLFATSTPNIDQAKKVVFNSDITMIPQNEKNAKQIESTEKVNLRTSKRKSDSLNEKAEVNNSRSKKAKLDQQQDDNAKENCKEDEMEVEKQQNKSADKSADKSDKQIERRSSRRTSQLQTKEKDDSQEINKKNTSLQSKSADKSADKSNKQIERQNSRRNSKLQTNEKDDNLELNKKNTTLQNKNLDNRQTDENRQLEEKRFDEKYEKKQMETIQLIKDQFHEFNSNLNADKLQEMMIVGLTKIVSNCKEPITSTIQIENIGKVSFTIEPFKVIEPPKKEFRCIEIQTDAKSTGDKNFQTEQAEMKTQEVNTEKTAFASAEVQCEEMETDEPVKNSAEENDKKEVEEVVNNVIDECDVDLNKRSTQNGNKLNGTINKSNFSIQFDDSTADRLTKEINGDLKQQEHKNEPDDKIDSDEIKKTVHDSSILEGLEDSDDEIIASSPIR